MNGLFRPEWSTLKKLMFLQSASGGSYETITGNPVSFTTVRSAPLKQLQVAFSPVQDLHGYSNPWPAGGGKNKLPNPLTGTITESDITVTANADGTFNVTGTSTASETKLILFDLVDDYVIPTSVGNGGNGCFYINNSFTGTGVAFQLYNGGTKVDEWALSAKNRTSSTYAGMAGKTVNKVGISFPSGATINGTIAPMFTEDGSTTATYSPYSNLCPISGWSSLTVEQRGKNLFDQNAATVNTPYFAPDGSVSSGAHLAVLTGIEIKSGSYAVSWGNTSSSLYVRINTLDSDGNFIQRILTANTQPQTVTFGPEVKQIQVCFDDTITNIQLELGSTASSYVPYNPLSRSISISLGSTVYSGYVDAVTGQGEVTWAARVIKDIPTRCFGKSTSGLLTVPAGFTQEAFPNLQNPASTIIATTAKCSMLVAMASNYITWAAQYNGKFAFNQGGVFYLCDTSCTTIEEYLTKYADAQFVYPLATPIPLSLTPQEINSLAGDNTMWADADSLTVEYRSN